MAVVNQGSGGIAPTSYPGPTTVIPRGLVPGTAAAAPAVGASTSGLPEPKPGTTAGAGQAPPTPPTPPPDSVDVAGSGYTPDYTTAIANNPGVASTIANNTASGATAAAQRQAALRAAYIAYGGASPGFSDPYGDIDQATRDAASGNQYSTLAGLQRNYQTSVNQFKAALAARGALQSGDEAYGQDQIDTGYGQGLYDAGNAFGGQATGLINSYVGVLGQNARDLSTAEGTAAGQEEQNPANQPVAATQATHSANLTAQYGQDIYTVTNADGTVTMYDRNGNPFTPPVYGAASTGGNAPYGYGIGQTL